MRIILTSVTVYKRMLHNNWLSSISRPRLPIGVHATKLMRTSDNSGVHEYNNERPANWVYFILKRSSSPNFHTVNTRKNLLCPSFDDGISGNSFCFLYTCELLYNGCLITYVHIHTTSLQ